MEYLHGPQTATLLDLKTSQKWCTSPGERKNPENQTDSHFPRTELLRNLEAEEDEEKHKKTRLNPVFRGAFFSFMTLGYFRPFFFQAQPARSQAMPAAPIRWAMPWCDPVGPVWWYKNLPWPKLGCLVKFNEIYIYIYDNDHHNEW